MASVGSALGSSLKLLSGPLLGTASRPHLGRTSGLTLGKFQDLGKTWVRLLAQDNIRCSDIDGSRALVRGSVRA